jgi:hypothetical protein
VESFSADDTLEVHFNKDDVCTFLDVQEILAAPPQICIDGTFAGSLDTQPGSSMRMMTAGVGLGFV